jgi:drug/metabolite transporter (DMT)-like permease
LPFSVQLGLLLALATAFVSILGFLYKYRGAVDAPPVEWRRPISSTIALFSNRWWTLGIIVATASWGFHVAALSLAPISLVQSVIAGGLVLLTVLAERVFGLPVTRREWIGVGLTAAGLAFLAATLGDTGHSKHSDYETWTLAAWVGSIVAVSVVPMFIAQRNSGHAGNLLGLAAGLQWGASDVTIKALSDHLGKDGILVLLTPLAAVILIISLVGLVVSARSLQLGSAVGVIAVTSASANLVTIASGLVVFGEPLPNGSLAIAVRMAAFALVVLAAALTPGPVAMTTPPPQPAR